MKPFQACSWNLARTAIVALFHFFTHIALGHETMPLYAFQEHSFFPEVKPTRHLLLWEQWHVVRDCGQAHTYAGLAIFAHTAHFHTPTEIATGTQWLACTLKWRHAATGSLLRVYCVHLPHSGKTDSQMTAALNSLERDVGLFQHSCPVLLLGDFNVQFFPMNDARNPCWVPDGNRAAKVHSILASLGLGFTPPHPHVHTWIAYARDGGASCIDWIVASGLTLTPLQVWPDWNYIVLSDHRPVTAWVQGPWTVSAPPPNLPPDLTLARNLTERLVMDTPDDHVVLSQVSTLLDPPTQPPQVCSTVLDPLTQEDDFEYTPYRPDVSPPALPQSHESNRCIKLFGRVCFPDALVSPPFRGDFSAQATTMMHLGHDTQDFGAVLQDQIQLFNQWATPRRFSPTWTELDARLDALCKRRHQMTCQRSPSLSPPPELGDLEREIVQLRTIRKGQKQAIVMRAALRDEPWAIEALTRANRWVPSPKQGFTLPGLQAQWRQQVQDYFSALFTPKGLPDPQHDLHLVLDRLAGLDATVEPAEIAPVTCSEVKQAISRLKLRKAAGSDGLTSEFFISHTETNLVWWAQFFTVVIRGSIWDWPRLWSISVVSLLPKVHSPEHPKQYRPLSLCAVSLKLFDYVLLGRLPSDFTAHTTFQRGGAVVGGQVGDVVSQLHMRIEKAVEWQHGLIVCRLDVQKAFDSLRWRAVLELLQARRVSPEVERSLLRGLISTRLLFPLPHDEVATVIPTCGVKQGSPSSPLLFALALDSALDEVAQIWPVDPFFSLMSVPDQVKQRAGLYADDILLFARTFPQLRRMFDEVAFALEPLGLLLSPGKTEVYANAFVAEPTSLLDLQGSKVLVGTCFDTFTHLGCKFNMHIGIRAHYSCAIAQMWGAFVRFRLTLTNQALPVSLRVQMLTKRVFAKLRWIIGGLPLSKAWVDKVNGTHRHMLRTMLKPHKLSTEGWREHTRQANVLVDQLLTTATPWYKVVIYTRYRWLGHLLRSQTGAGQLLKYKHMLWWRNQQATEANFSFRHRSRFCPFHRSDYELFIFFSEGVSVADHLRFASPSQDVLDYVSLAQDRLHWKYFEARWISFWKQRYEL